MDNQYSYYNGQDSGSYHYDYDYGYEEKPSGGKKKKKIPGIVKVIAFGLIFGLVASAAFQTGNFVAGKFFGGAQGTASAQKSGGKDSVGNVQLTTGNSGKATSDVAEIAKNAMPSVVSITNLSVRQVQSWFGGMQEEQLESAGSGIIIAENDSELLILTNNHVVEGSDTLTVSFIDEESVEADVKGTDANRDIAVIAVKLSDIKEETKRKIAVAQMGDSTAMEVGEPVIAIGNALGYGQSVTSGIVSATKRTLEGFDSELIQTDAAINPGNSGGALLNANGEVIGINTVKVATNAVEGMGYAIPISDAQDVITDLMNRKTRTKVAEGKQGYLGIQGIDVSADSAKMYDMPTGVYISEVISGGGAQKAGLTKGSIITKLDGSSVSDMETLQNLLQYYAAGEKVEVVVQVPSASGEYEEKTVTVTLGKRS